MEGRMDIDRLYIFADDTYEECGVILVSPNDRLVAVKIPNLAEDPRTGFMFSIADLKGLLAHLPKWRLHGFVHTHPGGPLEPSERDKSGVSLLFMNYAHYIYDPVSKGMVRFYPYTDTVEKIA